LVQEREHVTGQPEEPFLSVEGLTYQVDGQTILSGVSFEVWAGERVAVFGPSGVGKSTLIRLLNRLDEPTSGTIRISGQDYRDISPRLLRRRLGMVMQSPNLFPGTVADNLRFGPHAHGETLSDDMIRTLLSGVDLAGLEDREVSKLSGGEAQRVNLARTLANQPEALLLDEPTSALDQAAKRDVEETILSVINTQNVTCILVTHDRAQVTRLAERVLLLEDGRLVADGSIAEVLDAE
jgi:putative ABC transport system ATP-binding protein